MHLECRAYTFFKTTNQAIMGCWKATDCWGKLSILFFKRVKFCWFCVERRLFNLIQGSIPCDCPWYVCKNASYTQSETVEMLPFLNTVWFLCIWISGLLGEKIKKPNFLLIWRQFGIFLENFESHQSPELNSFAVEYEADIFSIIDS